MKTCALCGRKLRPEAWIFSRFTRQHYCADIGACDRRRLRRRRRTAVA